MIFKRKPPRRSAWLQGLLDAEKAMKEGDTVETKHMSQQAYPYWASFTSPEGISRAYGSKCGEYNRGVVAYLRHYVYVEDES